MNKIILLGRLVADPEVKYTQSGKIVTTFTLAVNRPFKGPDGKYETDFINIVLWNKPAEIVGNTVTKGQRLLVEGRLQIRSYTSQDGSKRWVTEVIGNQIEFIEKRESKEAGGFEGFGQPFDEEIPF